MTIRVVVVDDQPLVRAGLRQLLDTDDGIAVVAEAADGDTGIAAVRAHRPDVVLMDLRMPGRSGVEATRVIAADVPEARVLVLTTFDDDDTVLEAIGAGALGYLLKGIEPDELGAAIRTVAAGRAAVDAPVATALVRAVARIPPLDERSVELVGRLTRREREVVALASTGHANLDIADRLHLSVATVRTHIARAMATLHVHDRAALVVVAHRAGLDREAPLGLRRAT